MPRAVASLEGSEMRNGVLPLHFIKLRWQQHGNQLERGEAAGRSRQEIRSLRRWLTLSRAVHANEEDSGVLILSQDIQDSPLLTTGPHLRAQPEKLACPDCT